MERLWHDGDRIEIELPMDLTVETMPDGSDWVSLLYGPIVLAAPAGTDQVTGLRADDSRMGHVAHGPLVPIDSVDVLKSRAEDLSPWLVPDPSGEPLTFRLKGVIHPEREEGLLLKPFFNLHDERYQIVWQRFSPEELVIRDDRLAIEERLRSEREAATVDAVAIGEQQSEVEHDFRSVDSETGIFQNKRWRHGRDFSYTLSTRGEQNLELELTYWGGDQGRVFDILVNDTIIATQENSEDQPKGFYRVRYPLPDSLLGSASDTRLTVRFVGRGDSLAGGVFELRLMRAWEGVQQ
jgi:uncharacterized protein